MGLQIWLPLTKDLTNYGLNPMTFSLVNNSNGIGTIDNGKVAQFSYIRNTENTADYIKSDSTLLLDKNYSMCCWCKITKEGTTDSANGIITQHGHNSGGAGITMRYISSTDYRMSFNAGINKNDRVYHHYYGKTNIYNEWHHLCLTYNKTSQKYKMYVDGKIEDIFYNNSLIGQSVTYGENAIARPFCLFAWSTDHLTSASYRPCCQLNDVRVYDEELSAQQVKFISQGLILHYPFNNNFNRNLLINTKNPINNSSLAGNTQSVVYDEDLKENVFEIVRNVTTESYIYSSRTETISPSTTYTFSCDLKVDSNVRSVDFYWLSRNSVDSINGYDNITQKSSVSIPLRNEWCHCSWTFTTKNNDVNGYIRIDNNGSSASGVNASLRATNLKLEIGDKDTGYLPNEQDKEFLKFGYSLKNIEDKSGYQNHGLVSVGSLQGSIDTIKNNYAAVFDGSTAVAAKRNAMVTDAITYMCWLKMKDWREFTKVISCTEGGGWNFELQGNYIRISQNIQGNYYTLKSNFDITKAENNSWHHLAGTFNGKVQCIYIDGQLHASKSISENKIPITYHANNGIFIGAEAGSDLIQPGGSYLKGEVSDVRIYATALNEQEIQDICNTSFIIDKKANSFSFNFNESQNEFNITKQSIVNSKINELFNISDMNIKIEKDGSVWAKIFYHKNNQGSILFANANQSRYFNDENKYSRLYLLDYISPINKYEFKLLYPEDFPGEYNHWKQSLNPCNEYITPTSSGSQNASGYEAIHIDWNTNYWGGLTRQNSEINNNNCYLSGSTGHSNWFFAIGASTSWNDYIPGPSGSPVNVVELWVRVDEINNDYYTEVNDCQIFDNCLLAEGIYEI